MNSKRILLAAVFGVWVTSLLLANAMAATRTIPLSANTNITLKTFPANGSKLLVWLPEEPALVEDKSAVVAALNKQGVEVWLPEGESAWSLKTSEDNFRDVLPTDISQLLQTIRRQTSKTLYLMVGAGSSIKALLAVKQWQQEGMKAQDFAGTLLLNPDVYETLPDVRRKAKFHEIVKVTNTPVFIMLERASINYFYRDQLANAFLAAKSVLNVHVGHLDTQMTSAVVAGFNWLQTKKVVLTNTKKIKSRAVENVSIEEAHVGWIDKAAPALSLSLFDSADELFTLKSLQQKTNIVAFYPSWCNDCESDFEAFEAFYTQEGVDLVMVLVGKPDKQIQQLIEQSELTFPIVMDTEARYLHQWNVYALPTTFLLDKAKVIRYAVSGMFDWDDPELIDRLGEFE